MKTLDPSQLALQVAHDLRSPISLLKVLLTATPGLHEENRELAQMAFSRIEEITSTLLNSHREDPGVAVTSLEGMTDDIRLILEEKHFMHDRGFEFYQSLAGFEQDAVVIDRREFRRVLSNILENAAEATEAGKSIRVVASIERGLLEIQVIDHGRGIPENIVRLLNRRPCSFGKKNGNGLGLRHAQKTLRSWRGTLRVLSALGKGTTVVVRIPLV